MASPRTVLHLIDTGGPGGAETIFLNVVTGLDPERWRSIAVVPVRDWLWGALERHGVEPILLPTRGSFDLAYLRGVARLAREHRADLVQTHLLTSAVYASVAATPLGLPVVSTFHGPKDLSHSESYRSVKLRLLKRRRNRYVFVSDNLRQWFLRNASLDPTRAHVIHNGIDCATFRPQPAPDVRADLGARPGEVLIGAVGNLRAPKDYPTFLRAAALLAQRSSAYRFVIVGAADEPIRSELEALRRELDLGDRLLLAGFREDIERVMNALDVYVLSSSNEGFSLTTVQAMACGVPVVATRSGGPEEIVEDGRSGILIPAGDPTALANAIDGVVSDAKMREAFAVAGRERAMHAFSIDSMVAGYAELYDRCLRVSAPRQSGEPARPRAAAGV